jgi:hypothetical protein
MWVLMPAASRSSPGWSPSSVFEPDPESPGVIAPKNEKWSACQLIAVPVRGVPPAPMPAPWP